MTVPADAPGYGQALADEFIPMRSGYVLTGVFGLTTALLGLIVGLPFARRPIFELIASAILAVVLGVIGIIGMRFALRRVVPAPSEAVVVPAPIPIGRLVVTAAVRVALVVLSLFDLLSVSLLGGTVGLSLAILWAARRIQQFEREDGRCVLRRRGPTPDRYLYAGPCP